MSITDTQEVTCQIRDIITEAADISVRRYSNSTKKLSKSAAYKKQNTHKKTRTKWFDSNLTKMRKRVISNGKLYTMYHNDTIVRGRYFKLYRMYNKTKKYKERQYKKTDVRAD